MSLLCNDFMPNILKTKLLVLVIMAFLITLNLFRAEASSCLINVSNSNLTIQINQSNCKSFSIYFKTGVSNSIIDCENISFSASSRILLEGFNNEDYLFNCSFDGANISLGNHSFINLISPKLTNFNVSYGENSSVTVGYFIHVTVFEPFGSNSVIPFGSRIAAFGYIIPLFNNTIQLNNTELQMEPSFSSGIVDLIGKLNKTMQFGVYGQNQTQIFFNFSKRNYGNIFGYKRFAVPEYTLTRNKKIEYNPYAIEYSFLSYDQLVMFFLNITNDTTLMPVYVQPAIQLPYDT